MVPVPGAPLFVPGQPAAASADTLIGLHQLLTSPVPNLAVLVARTVGSGIQPRPHRPSVPINPVVKRILQFPAYQCKKLIFKNDLF